MRVLHVIPAIARRYGGPSQVALATCRALRALEVDARLLATDADGPRGALPGGDLELEGVPCRLERRDWGEAVKYSRGLARWLDAHLAGFEVVHIHAIFSHAPLAAAAACRRARIPYVVRPLGTLDPWSLAQKRWRKRLAWHLGVRRLLRDAAAIHYTTEDERRAAEGPLGLRGGVVVPNGVDLSGLEAEARAGCPVVRPPFVLALGRIHPKKRLELLVEAFAHVPPGVQLVLAGDGEAEHVADLRRRVQSSGLGDRVVLPGWLSGPTKAATLAAASVLAMTSHQENFGLAAAEAMALGTPVVLTRGVNLASEVVEAGAGWVAGDDPASLGELLTRLLSDEAERARRGEAARGVARARYGWEGVARRLVALYDEVARPR